jgi:hypothetical protein
MRKKTYGEIKIKNAFTLLFLNKQLKLIKASNYETIKYLLYFLDYFKIVTYVIIIYLENILWKKFKGYILFLNNLSFKSIGFNQIENKSLLSLKICLTVYFYSQWLITNFMIIALLQVIKINLMYLFLEKIKPICC